MALSISYRLAGIAANEQKIPTPPSPIGLLSVVVVDGLLDRYRRQQCSLVQHRNLPTAVEKSIVSQLSSGATRRQL